jgi:hypothetical protein
MADFQLSAKAKELLELRRKERKALAEKRKEAGDTALDKAIIEADGDETQLILHKLPEEHGGLVILMKPTPEYRASYQKRLQAAFDRDGKRSGADPMAIITSFVENKKYLVHPPLDELQSWQQQYPDLYTTIEDTARQQCSGDGAGKG